MNELVRAEKVWKEISDLPSATLRILTVHEMMMIFAYLRPQGPVGAVKSQVLRELEAILAKIKKRRGGSEHNLKLV